MNSDYYTCERKLEEKQNVSINTIVVLLYTIINFDEDRKKRNQRKRKW